MPNVGENWVCPYCNHAQVLADERHELIKGAIEAEGCAEGPLAYGLITTICANQECRKVCIEFRLYVRADLPRGGWNAARLLKEWRLLPATFAKPQPDYIPNAIRDDYYEACAIRDMSPKAAATLARRCIQGMIRDFCGISKSRLAVEINELRRQVDDNMGPRGVETDTVDAIDHVRAIGNIGAHMEADINVIVDVDTDEAQKLIELIELLLEEWYVAREARRLRLEALGVIAENKKAARNKGAIVTGAAPASQLSTKD